MLKTISIIICLLYPLLSFSQDRIDALILKKDYRGALTAIEKSLQHSPSADLFFKKSTVLKKQMLYPQSLQALDQAILLDSGNTNYLEERAELYEALGNYDSAIKNYREALRIAPENLLISYNMGISFIRINDYPNAIKTFEEIYKKDSTNLMFNKYYALAAYKAGKNKLATSLYEKYILENPNDLSAYLNLAHAYGETRNDTAAFKILITAKRRFPNNKLLDLKYANSVFTWRNYQAAADAYRDYMAKYDTTFPVLKNYGICLYQTQHEKEAIEELEKCYSDFPNDPYINFYLGVSHKKLAEYELAANYIDFAIYASLPEFLPEMYHHLGQTYGNMRQFEKSIEALKKAYELDNRKVEVLFEIATTYEEYNFNKTLALNYYKLYLMEAGEKARNANYALDRIKKIKEELFFEE